MRRIGLLLVCVACGFAAGCAMLNEGKDAGEATLNAMKPRDHDYRDDANEGEVYHDEWEGAGKEGRASEAKEHEWDSWTKNLMSPKAQSIERNLGYGY